MLRVLSTFILTFCILNQASACFILYLNDGKKIIVGNHEDWFARDAAMRVYPPLPGRYGSVVFTFYSEGWAQGGMNEHGLFFDAAQTPYQEVKKDGKETFPGYIWQAVLDRCKTVDEAIDFIQKFALPDLAESHIVIADAVGHAARIGVKSGSIVIEKKDGPWLLQTNFNPWQPELSEDPVCRRYQAGEDWLRVHGEASAENMKSILEKTHQDSLTIYSNIYDLTAKTITTYTRLDFKQPVVVSLPKIFQVGACMLPLDTLVRSADAWKNCRTTSPAGLTIGGKVLDAQTGEPIPFANIGLARRNIGTLSDPDGTFVLDIPQLWREEAVMFSSVGYLPASITPGNRPSGPVTIMLQPHSQVLEAVTVKGKKLNRRARLGWMGGRDGILPFDTIQGGGVAALLVEAPVVPVLAEKLQVRLMYNSKDTLRFRFHIYSFDSIAQTPGEELLQRDIMLTETKRFGWLRFDLASYAIAIDRKKFCIGFEWIDNRSTRQRMLTGLQAWEKWKRSEYENGNSQVEKSSVNQDGKIVATYKYHGNMMNWPGFKDLPPFTGLMIETGKNEKTMALRTFERKTSFGTWKEVKSTLNAVITVAY